MRSKLRGPAEFIDTVSNLLGAFDNLHHEVQETIAAGNKVVQIMCDDDGSIQETSLLFLQLEIISLI